MWRGSGTETNLYRDCAATPAPPFLLVELVGSCPTAGPGMHACMVRRLSIIHSTKYASEMTYSLYVRVWSMHGQWIKKVMQMCLRWDGIHASLPVWERLYHAVISVLLHVCPTWYFIIVYMKCSHLIQVAKFLMCVWKWEGRCRNTERLKHTQAHLRNGACASKWIEKVRYNWIHDCSVMGYIGASFQVGAQLLVYLMSASVSYECVCVVYLAVAYLNTTYL